MGPPKPPSGTEAEGNGTSDGTQCPRCARGPFKHLRKHLQTCRGRALGVGGSDTTAVEGMRCPRCNRGPFMHMGQHLEACREWHASAELTKCPLCANTVEDIASHEQHCRGRARCFRCHLGFPTVEAAKEHMNTRCLDLACPNPGCGRSFGSRRSLTMHTNTCREEEILARRPSASPGGSRGGRDGPPLPSSSSLPPPIAFYSCGMCREWFRTETECRDHERLCRRRRGVSVSHR